MERGLTAAGVGGEGCVALNVARAGKSEQECYLFLAGNRALRFWAARASLAGLANTAARSPNSRELQTRYFCRRVSHSLQFRTPQALANAAVMCRTSHEEHCRYFIWVR